MKRHKIKNRVCDPWLIPKWKMGPFFHSYRLMNAFVLSLSRKQQSSHLLSTQTLLLKGRQKMVCPLQRCKGIAVFKETQPPQEEHQKTFTKGESSKEQRAGYPATHTFQKNPSPGSSMEPCD